MPRTIIEEEQKEIDTILRDFLKNSEAKGALFADLSGALLSEQGFVQRFDTSALAVLSAGTVASTRQMAKIIGEPLFTDLFHQGKRDHIYLSIIGDQAVLVVIFDNSTTLGLVRLYSRQAVKALRQVLSKMAVRDSKPTKMKIPQPQEVPQDIFPEAEKLKEQQ